MDSSVAPLLLLVMIIVMVPVLRLEFEILSHLYGKLYNLFSPLERQKKSEDPENSKCPKSDMHIESNRNVFMKENLVEEVCGGPKYRVLNFQVNRGTHDLPVKIEIDIAVHSEPQIDRFVNTPEQKSRKEQDIEHVHHKNIDVRDNGDKRLELVEVQECHD